MKFGESDLSIIRKEMMAKNNNVLKMIKIRTIMKQFWETLVQIVD